MKQLSALSVINRNNLYAQLRTSITHHSNAIEGISLTFGETKKLLEQGYTASSKPIHEQLVVLGFADAFDFVVREANNSSVKLSSSFIKDIHAILFDKALKISPERIERPIGAWRTDERYIKGVDIKLSSPLRIDQDIENLLFRSKSNASIFSLAQFHIDFELIHPFADGNGRVGRLITTYQAIKNDIIPPLILNENRKDYLDSLGDANKLEIFLIDAIQNSVNLIGLN